MDSNKRTLLEKETYRNYMLLMFRNGLKEIWTDQYRNIKIGRAHV